jgi:hypothetical protein
LNVTKPLSDLPKFSLTVSNDIPAGTEEVVICGQLISVNYGASKNDLRNAAMWSDDIVKLELAQGVVHLEVGDAAPSDESYDDEGNPNKHFETAATLDKYVVD